MPTPVNRAKIQLARGNYSNIAASLSDLVDGELCYAKDQNKLYMVEGTVLTPIEVDIEQVEDAIASIIVGGTGLTATQDDPNNTLTISLDDTAVTNGTYGSSSAIPIITVDQQGRITAASTTSIDTDALTLSVHNQSGATLSKGVPVYVSGTHNSGKPIVELADNDGTNTYPAIGLVYADIADGSDGEVAISGHLLNVDTSSYTAGAALYLDNTAGGLTTTRPTASTEKVQKVGLVTKSHASSGSILIIGAGRTNDVNNEITALTGVALNASNLGTFTGATIADNTDIKSALQALETAAESQFTTTDGNFTVSGDLTVNGSTTTVNSTTLQVDDKNIELATIVATTFTGDATAGSADITNVSDTTNLIPGVAISITSGGGTVTLPATTILSVSGTTVTLNDAFTGTGSNSGVTFSAGGPADTTADGGGITLKGSTDKTISWVDSTDAWTFSEHINIADTKSYYMNGTAVLTYDGSSNKILDSVIVDGGTY